MLLTRPRFRRSRLCTNSHIIVPHVTAAQILNAVLSIGIAAPLRWSGDTLARGRSAEAMRPIQYSTICSFTGVSSPNMIQPPSTPAISGSRFSSLPKFILRCTRTKRWYSATYIPRRVACCRVAVTTLLRRSFGDPEAKSMTITSACGKRIFAPYTIPLRAPFTIVKSEWYLGFSITRSTAACTPLIISIKLLWRPMRGYSCVT